MRERLRFAGRIAGLGSSSGTRIVVGRWQDTPYGAFADAMVETSDGHRVLLAPNPEVADLLDATYFFDEVRVEPFAVTDSPHGWDVRSPSLALDLVFGRRRPVGHVLRAVPRRVAEHPAWCTVTDPGARLVMRGVRTRGSARGGRREWYGATDLHDLTWASGSFDGADLGDLAPVDPPCRYGFSSAPRRPSVTRVVSTIEV